MAAAVSDMLGIEKLKSSVEEDDEIVVLLGKQFRIDWRAEISKIFWFTYRSGFPSMEPCGYSDDAGWGCMLRSCQMLMATALQRHLGEKRRMDIIQWFNDEPGEKCIYSIHNMVRCGLRYDMLPGEWYGPGVASHVLRDLCEMHDAALDDAHDLFMTVTSQERPLCEEDVLLSVTKPSSAEEETANTYSLETPTSCDEDIQHNFDPLLRPPPSIERQKQNAQKRTKAKRQRLESPWCKSALIIIPLRLGLAKLDPIYFDALLATLQFPQSLGFVGGRPRQALYFIGSVSKQLIGLDPHIVQPATSNIFSKSHLDSLVCLQPRKVHLDAIDPSLALAFYCRDRNDFSDLSRRIKHLASLSNPPLFDIIQRRPKRRRQHTNSTLSLPPLVPSGLAGTGAESHLDDDDDDTASSLNDDLLLDDDDDENVSTASNDDDFVLV
uniref:Cysteine protease n=1 Tax=Aureoumbra lagunensis TaxID=44058 RepID=A0A7S3NKN2_9STRA|mmetsp:Transcript_3273/g.4538  ORF Transcript_3273/g.4538 Transcript_3273/m.4538 type:complete len:438 (+) Transcript_3273:50-1363(+)